MNREFAENVYLTLQGMAADGFKVEGVEDAFAQGQLCASYYENMHEAYSRLCSRLGVLEEDRDVEEIIDSLMRITDILAIKMYEYGAAFGAEDHDIRTPDA